MTDPMEGRLLAQRALLSRLVAALGDDGIDAWLAERDHYEGLDEDPGAVPDESFAIESAMADELRLIREAVERLRGR